MLIWGGRGGGGLFSERKCSHQENAVTKICAQTTLTTHSICKYCSLMETQIFLNVFFCLSNSKFNKQRFQGASRQYKANISLHWHRKCRWRKILKFTLPVLSHVDEHETRIIKKLKCEHRNFSKTTKNLNIWSITTFHCTMFCVNLLDSFYKKERNTTAEYDRLWIHAYQCRLLFGVSL